MTTVAGAGASATTAIHGSAHRRCWPSARLRSWATRSTQAVIDDAELYVERQLEAVNRLNDATEVNRQAFFLYVLAEAGSNVSGDADELMAEHRALMDPYAKALLAMAYESERRFRREPGRAAD